MLLCSSSAPVGDVTKLGASAAASPRADRPEGPTTAQHASSSSTVVCSKGCSERTLPAQLLLLLLLSWPLPARPAPETSASGRMRCWCRSMAASMAVGLVVVS